MKLHQGVHRLNRFGGYTTTTRCGPMNKKCDDGLNIAERDADVTCGFCLRSMKISQRLRVAKARREAAAAE